MAAAPAQQDHSTFDGRDRQALETVNMLENPLLDPNRTEYDDEQVLPGGEFSVKQTHIGFCPEDVILQIQMKAVVICNDDFAPVVSFPYTNLVMWSQTGSDVTLMTMSNLKRVVFTARTRWHAKKICKKLGEITEEISAEFVRKEQFWGESSETAADKERVETLKGMWGTESEDAELEAELDESTFSVFGVKQMHLPPVTEGDGEEIPEYVILRVGFGGVELVVRETGLQVQTIEWNEILLWRSDGQAVIIVLAASNKQVTLLTDSADAVIGALTKTAEAVRKKTLHETTNRRGNELPAAAYGFRQQLARFQGPSVAVDEAWMQEGEGKLAALVSAVIGSANMQESIQTRQQLKAIFSTVDTAETGKLNVYQLKELMDLLKIHGEEGKALGMDELNEIMEEMDAFHGTGEVSFDDFVTWALSSSTGAGASDILRMRVTHRKKEMHSIEQLFDKVDQDCDGKMDSADLKLLIKHIGEMKRQMRC